MSRFAAYAQLIRLPNLPTAFADIGLAALALHVHAPFDESDGGFPVVRFLLILVASGSLYCAGMVWNDFFDVEQDSRERPSRPLPSGRIGRREAAYLGSGLLAGGVLAAFSAGRTSFIVSIFLVAAVLLYDRFLKRFWAGPIGMGLCRFLNVLLGLSLAGSIPMPWGGHLALVVGLYIVGVTWLARTEAVRTRTLDVRGASIVMLLSLLLALPLPVTTDRSAASPLFPYLLVLLGFVLGIPLSRALATPTPDRVQDAVKRCLLGLVLLDSVLAVALAGTVGLLLLLLIVPILLLRRMQRLYVT